MQIAPIVRTEIVGGRVNISLGESTAEEARGLATALRGELLHGPRVVPPPR